MRAIKIDVESKSVYEIEIQDGLQNIYDAIGNNCSLIEAPIRFNESDALLCDEEITFRLDDMKGAFIIEDHLLISPIINNAIIMGCDEEGESADCIISLEYIQERTHFLSIKPNLD